ncbi:hypothetical protein EDC61_12027 [Sulfuritortus calidifontis]|uniref:TonB-dependent receptor n=1 Tax=Sulfuritortus calidifontis TaxID=1914471 RepID=A0A4R3JR49_9PROT|nr:TonB-dependent receptor [Sulfuritortus calidifontis]TCS69466.1 hypothetical protein EDC61_12027 [Sulfuritortus calidifontis]
MFKRTLLACALLTVAQPSSAEGDLDAIRQEIAQMKAQYEARIAALEARLKEAEGRPVGSTANTAASHDHDHGRGFNPDVSLILQGQYAQRKDIPERTITGFLPAGHVHGSERGFSVDHTELVLSADIDPTFRGYANFALIDQSVSVEEAWFQTLGLGEGFSLKAGRFYSGLGYLNERHPHAWDFADAPLMYQALFGERFAHDGMQLKWLAPTETFLEFGVEAGNGNAFPGANGNSSGIGAFSTFAKIGGDLGASHSWRAGLAYLSANPKARTAHWEDANGDAVGTTFTGDSKAWIADFVWKWAPQGNPKTRNLTLQAEYFRREESGRLACDGAGTLCAGDPSDRHRSKQSGWYAQTVYQFMPRWRAGLRYERLDSGTLDFGGLPLDAPDYNPDKTSLMLDWSPSEFSRIRLQFARDRSMQGIDENQVTLQYIMSLGAHGAHKF